MQTEQQIVQTYKVLEWPHPILETRAAEVTVFDEELLTTVKRMHATMDEFDGVGLAANQVGILKRIFVVYISSPDDEKKEPNPPWWLNKRLTLINPEISALSGRIAFAEGCLSFPGIYENIDRSDRIHVKASDEFGKVFEFDADGFLAVCIQHELDHINGIVFTKRMSRLKAQIVRTRIQKNLQQNKS